MWRSLFLTVAPKGTRSRKSSVLREYMVANCNSFIFRQFHPKKNKLIFVLPTFCSHIFSFSDICYEVAGMVKGRWQNNLLHVAHARGLIITPK